MEANGPNGQNACNDQRFFSWGILLVVVYLFVSLRLVVRLAKTNFNLVLRLFYAGQDGAGRKKVEICVERPLNRDFDSLTYAGR